MKQMGLIAVMLILIAFVFVSSANAFNIFVWQKDNGLTVQDRVFNNQALNATQSITRTLDVLDYDYTVNRNLPNDLSEYDLIMIPLSFYCPG